MKTRPVEPARIVLGADGVPRSADDADIFHPPIGAAAQAAHVFLGGNGLPERWSGRQRFAILELGFGLGNNFAATLRAWRDDPRRCRQLDYVAVERHPPTRDDLERIHGADSDLVAAWPPLVPGVHVLDFDAGQVRLLLAFGDVRSLLPELRVAADAVFLDSFDPDADPAMWDRRMLKLLGRRVAPGATAATWSVARHVRDGLVSAGFDVERVAGIGGKRQVTLARWRPRFALDAPALPPAKRDAIVVGAGLAGAWTARALAAVGWNVTVLDRHDAPAAETSGNPAGIFHGTVHGDDGPHARLLRAAALLAARELRQAVADGVPGAIDGLLRLDVRGAAAMQALADAQRLPPDWVQVLDADAASERAGVALPSAAWFYPAAGWADPRALTHWALRTDGVRFVGACTVGRIARGDDGWHAIDAAGTRIATAPVLVLANAAGAAGLVQPLGLQWPLSSTRGVLGSWHGAATPLRLPLAGDGYALPAGGGLHFGGADDDAGNLERLQRLTGLRPPPGATLDSRVGWRLQMPDRLPLAGPVPQPTTTGRDDQSRYWPRQQGLFMLAALGGRGITLAPLLGRLVAAWIAGAPLPLEQSLIDAVDPARALVRTARRVAGRAVQRA